MLEKRILFLVICVAALCLNTAPVMADFVDLWAFDTQMTVDVTGAMDGTTATTTIEARDPTISYMNMFIKEDDGTVQQSLFGARYDLTAVLNFTGSGDSYSAEGELIVNDSSGARIAADFVSKTITFEPLIPGNPYSNTMYVSGYLSPQGSSSSILVGGSSTTWDFDTLSLAGNIASFDSGNMVVLEYNVNYGSLQEFFAVGDAQAYGILNATVTPLPAAVILGVLGLGVAGLKLRKYA